MYKLAQAALVSHVPAVPKYLPVQLNPPRVPPSRCLGRPVPVGVGLVQVKVPDRAGSLMLATGYNHQPAQEYGVPTGLRTLLAVAGGATVPPFYPRFRSCSLLET